MESRDPDILARRFLDGDLTEAELEPALHRIAEDAEARTLLQFEAKMTQDLAATRSAEPPPDFAAETIEAVAAADPAASTGPSVWDQLEALWTRLTAPVLLRLRPAYAGLALLLAGLGAWVAWPSAPPGPQTASNMASEPQQTVQQADISSTRETVWIRFMYTDSQADSVAVAGDFSQWNPIPLAPRDVDGETVWTGLVPVPRGEHEYQFLINGDRWVADPLAPVTRDDGFGAENAVLNV